MFEIEKNVTMQQGDVYPFSEMEVGDSFFVPCEGAKKASARNAAARYERYHDGVFFSSRTVEGGIRIWRVESRKRRAYRRLKQQASDE